MSSARPHRLFRSLLISSDSRVVPSGLFFASSELQATSSASSAMVPRLLTVLFSRAVITEGRPRAVPVRVGRGGSLVFGGIVLAGVPAPIIFNKV